MQQSKQPIGPRKGAHLCRAVSFVSALLVAGATACADNAEIRQRGNQWTLRTSRMERVIALENGRLVLQRFTDRTTGRELVARSVVAEEFLPPEAGVTEGQKGSGGEWRLLGSKKSSLPQGAPTSPRLSNLVNFGLDARLAGMAAKALSRSRRQ